MTKASSKPFLYTRSDGFTETPDGDFAIVMRVRTGCNADICWFQYRPGFSADPVRVEWAPDDTILLLPKEVVVGLLRARYARLPTPEEVDAFLAGPLPEQISATAAVQAEDTAVPAQVAPQAAETPAVVPVPAAAPENAPLAAPVAASAEELANAAPLVAPVATAVPARDTTVLATPPAHVDSTAPVLPALVDAAPAVEPVAAPPVAVPDSVVKAPPKRR